MSDIQFKKVRKAYRDLLVIPELDLMVREGEFMALVGPSGCAKSTTLRMIAGLETITSGQLLIGGKTANDLSPAERNISMVFQSYALFPNMTVRGNLSFGLKLRRSSVSNIESEVNRVANLLGLGDLLDRKPRQLSGGQAQRVALGRAMIRKPDAYLFDEPLSNLDAELRVQMRGEIQDMQKRHGTTTVYVTHDQIEAMTMGDRIAVMNNGMIMQVGVPTELYKRPANIFVARFIGSPRMNLLACSDLLKESAATDDLGFRPNDILGIRPEHLNIQQESNCIEIGKAVVERIEDIGHEILVHLDNSCGSRLIARIHERFREVVKLGCSVSLSLMPNQLHAFDSKTGNRIS